MENRLAEEKWRCYWHRNFGRCATWPFAFLTFLLQLQRKLHVRLTTSSSPVTHLYLWVYRGGKGRLGRPRSSSSLSFSWRSLVCDSCQYKEMVQDLWKITRCNMGELTFNWDVSGIPVMWPHNLMFHHNLIPLSLLVSSSAHQIADVFNGGGKGATFQLVDPRHTQLCC